MITVNIFMLHVCVLKCLSCSSAREFVSANENQVGKNHKQHHPNGNFVCVNVQILWTNIIATGSCYLCK